MSRHLSQDGEAEVHEFHRDHGVFGLLALDDEALDVFTDFRAGLAGHLDAAEDREVDAAVGIYGVAGDVL